MKKPNSNRFRIAVAMSVALAGMINNARAVLNYWDPGGATVLTTSTETWEHTKWATSATPTASTVAWTEGVAAAFAAGTSTVTNQTYTVTANANHTVAGFFNGGVSDAVSTNLQITGTGVLTVASGAQGFLTFTGGNTTINNVLAGPGTPQTQGTGSWFFFGTNTFTGGLQINTGGGFNFNNNSSFGTGAITNLVSSSVLATPLNDGGGNPTGATSPLTIANTMKPYGAGSSTITVVGNASAPITWTGPWQMGGAAGTTLTLDTRSGTMTISGVISGAQNIQKNNSTGTLILSGANTYSGKTIAGTGILSVSSLNKVTGGAAASNLGHPTTAANGTIGFGSGATGGTLIYTGAGETTDRVIDLQGTTGGGTIQADGTGNLVFTAVNTATGVGAKTLTLTGSGATTNSIGKIVDSTSATSLSKAGTTTWTLSAANTYSGTTSVTAGKLQLANAASLGTNTLTWSTGSIDNITGSDLTLANNITVGGNPTYVGSANALTFTGTATISGNRTFTVSANTLSLGSVVESGNGRNLTKSGSGTLIVTGGLAHTGTTTISAGTLKLTGSSQLAVTNFGFYSNALAVTGTFDYSSSASQMLMGNISGAGSILVNGSGSLICAGTNTPTFTGTITVNSSSLVAGVPNGFPTNGTININGGTVDMGANNATVKALKYAGVSKPVGTYGAIGSGAQHENAQFTGTGILTVTTGATSTTVVTSDNQSTTVGQAVGFTVTVTGNGGDGSTPIGTATLYDNGISIATVSLSGSGNVASGSFSTSTLGYGSHPMTATWNGNDSYGASTSATYNQFVVQPPVITSPATASTVVADAGTNVTLSVALQDPNGATYQWRRGGIALFDGANNNAATVAGSTVATLTLISVRAADATQGNYTCVAQNAAGTATSLAYTLVVNDPAISVQPTNSTFECGSNGCLSVTAFGTTNANGVLTYQWYTPNPSGTAIANATNSTLCFNTVHFTDAGSYSVVVSNAFGNSVTSQVAVVTVQDTTGPVVTVNGLADLTVECHGSFSDPGATATDACQGATTIASATSGSVNLNAVGDYTLSYTANDSFNNPGTVATRVVHVRDTTAPAVTLTGGASVNVECHTSFSDPGASASDACAGSLSVSTSGTLDVTTTGIYTRTYTATDPSGNSGTATRTVHVIDSTGPSLVGVPADTTAECGSIPTAAIVTATDTCDSNPNVGLSESTIAGSCAQSYTLVRTWTATDASGNTSTGAQHITVHDTTAPVVSLVGDASMNVECHSSFVDPGATANDACAGSVSVAASGSVDTDTSGDYTMTYSATDPCGNTGTATRVVHVVDTTAPLVTITGPNPDTVCAFTTYNDPGATASDSCSGSINAPANTTLDTSVVGDYTLTYTAQDATGNTSTATRVVSVVECGDPLIVSQPANVIATSKSNVTFSVVATGTAPFTYQWYFKKANTTVFKKMLHSASIPVVNAATLNINNASKTLNVGTYYCAVTNSLGNGTNSATATLAVFDAPVVKILPSTKTLLAGLNYNMIAKVRSGSPVSSFQWSKDGDPIPGATTSVLSFVNVQTNDSGSYSCTVSNSAPTSGTATCVLTVDQDLDNPKSVLILHPHDMKNHAALLPGGTGLVSPIATDTNLAPVVTFEAKALDKGLITAVGVTLTNNGVLITNAVGTVVYSKDLTVGTNAAAGKPVTFLGQLTLVDGTNKVAAYATDSDGNTTYSHVEELYYVGNTSPLTLVTNNLGGISASRDRVWGTPGNGVNLEVGVTYKLRAVVKSPLHKFAHWEASDPTALQGDTNSTSVSFTMRTNLIITADFNP